MLSFVVCNVPSVFGADNNAMRKAVQEGNLELMKQLKEQGVDVNAISNDGTPLKIAKLRLSKAPPNSSAAVNINRVIEWLRDHGGIE